MNVIDKGFFEEKREWSKIKDQILGGYLPPYLTKVGKLGKKIVLIDAFAGPGKFADGTAGSPLIISHTADKFVPSQHIVIFVNKKKLNHDNLCYLFKKKIDEGKVIPINGDARMLLSKLENILNDETLLLYLDPFGLKGCDFKSILPFLNRKNTNSSELIMNISVPIIHRLAAKKNVIDGNINQKVRAFHNTLSNALGGDYWKEFLFNEKLTPYEQIDKVMTTYKKLLQNYLPVVGFCPVYESHERSILKYYVFFASRHIDAAILMNDIMYAAYWKHIWQAKTKGTLFETGDMDFILPADYYSKLEEAVFEQLGSEKLRRVDIWQKIVLDKFMRFKSSDYRNIIVSLLKKKEIEFIDSRGTGRLNDDSIIYRIK